MNFLRIFTRKNTAIDVGASGLRKRVWRVPAGEHGGDAGGAQERIVIRHHRKTLDCGGIWRLLSYAFHVRGNLAGFHSRVLCEIAARDFVDFWGERIGLQAGEGAGQVVDGVIRAGDGAMPAGIQRFKLKIDVNFFAGLNSSEEPLVFVLFKFAAVQIDAVFGIHPVAMFS